MPLLPPRNLPFAPPSSSQSNASKVGLVAGSATPPQRGSADAEAGARGLTPGGDGGGAGGGGSGKKPHRKNGVDPSTPSRSRNVPFSPSAASPSSPLRAGPSSPLATTSSPAGQLARQDETTFHRRLRTLLYDHRAARDAWDDIVSLEGAKSLAAFSRLAARLDELQSQHGAKLPSTYAALPASLSLTQNEADRRTYEEMRKTIAELESERETLFNVLNVRLSKPASKMQALNEVAETLLIEATRTKGDLFAFEQEAWTTWPMARFVDVLQTLGARYAAQTDQLQSIGALLVQQGCTLFHPPPAVAERKRDEKNDAEEDEDESEEAVQRTESAEQKQRRKARALIRQRVLEEWQLLPLLQDDRDDRCVDSVWFDDICQAEVGRWDEEK